MRLVGTSLCCSSSSKARPTRIMFSVRLKRVRSRVVQPVFYNVFFFSKHKQRCLDVIAKSLDEKEPCLHSPYVNVIRHTCMY